MSAADPALQPGLVVANHGRHFVVEDAQGERRICHSRGKKSEAVVGDRVLWRPSRDEGTIERIEERRNLLYRQDEVRTKSFAANLDQLLVLLAADPPFSGEQLARALIAAEAAHIEAFVVLNKSDLGPSFEAASERLEPYRRMGLRVLALSLKQAQPGLAELRATMLGKTTLLLGPSGAGKSTLTNALVPDARAQTGEISQALRSGKHTTTSTSWYWLDKASGSALIDSPGFQAFGLHHVPAMELARCMPDLRVHLGQCRFHNCTHLHEPGCGVTRALDAADPASRVDAERYRLYRLLFEELSQSRY